MSREPKGNVVLEAQHVMTTGVLKNCHPLRLQDWVEADKSAKDALRELLDAGPIVVEELVELRRSQKSSFRVQRRAKFKGKLLGQTAKTPTNARQDRQGWYYGPLVKLEEYLDALRTFPLLVESEKPDRISGLQYTLECYNLTDSGLGVEYPKQDPPVWTNPLVLKLESWDEGPSWGIPRSKRVATIEEVLDWFLDQAINSTIDPWDTDPIGRPLTVDAWDDFTGRLWTEVLGVKVNSSDRYLLVTTSTTVQLGERSCPLCLKVDLPTKEDSRLRLQLACWLSYKTTPFNQIVAMVLPRVPEPNDGHGTA